MPVHNPTACNNHTATAATTTTLSCASRFVRGRLSAACKPDRGHHAGRHLVVTGGKAIMEETGGRTKRIMADKDNATIMDGAGMQKNIEGRIKQLPGLFAVVAGVEN